MVTVREKERWDIASNVPTLFLLARDYSDRDFGNEEQSIGVASNGEMTY